MKVQKIKSSPYVYSWIVLDNNRLPCLHHLFKQNCRSNFRQQFPRKTNKLKGVTLRAELHSVLMQLIVFNHYLL